MRITQICSTQGPERDTVNVALYILKFGTDCFTFVKGARVKFYIYVCLIYRTFSAVGLDTL